MTGRTRDALAKLALLSAALIWGSSFFILKNATDAFPPLSLIATRFTIGTLLLSLIFARRLRALTPRAVKKGALAGALLFLAYNVQTLGLTETTPGNNAFLTASYCVMVPFVHWAVSKRRPRARNLFAALVMISGIGLIALKDGLSIARGDALTLVSGLFYALHIVIVSHLGADEDPVVLTIVQFAVCAILGWTAGLSLETLPLASAFTPELTAAVLYLSVVATSMALLLQIVGQKYTSPASASILLSLESVFGLGFSVLFYGERVSSMQGVGFAFIFAAVLLSELPLPGKRRAPRANPLPDEARRVSGG